jgi:putative SOS response-associated peptidase YedK
MCGRYRIKDTAAVDDLTRRLFGIPQWASGPIPPRYNIAPSQALPALARTGAGAVESVILRWGFDSGWSPSGAAPLRPINAQAETVATKAMFRDATQRRRCLIPADGFYEWRRLSATDRQAFDIHLRGGRPFYFAGIFGPTTAEQIPGCAVLTTRANTSVAAVHLRMPVILEGDAARQWLAPSPPDAQTLATLAAPPAADDVELVPVSSRVNSPAHDDASCLDPVSLTPTATPPQQGLLFD